jgi:hypothetical protein
LTNGESVMNMAEFLCSVSGQAVIWTLLAGAVGFGLVAIFSPRLFTALNARTSLWIDIDRFTRKLDRRVDVDDRVARHPRVLGALSVIAAVTLAGLSIRYPYGGRWVVLGFLGFVAVAGLLALCSPPRFSRVARWGSIWVDTNKLVDKLQRRIDIDRYVLKYCRLFGFTVLGAVAVLGSMLICAGCL